MAYELPKLALLSAARTTSGQSDAVAPQSRGNWLNLLIDVTAASGTSPTLDLTVEWYHDAAAVWSRADPADAFTQITAAGVKVKQFSIKGNLYRIVWAIGGTSPSFTFSATEYITSG